MAWWNQGNYPLKVGQSKFLKILDFYLFNCPVEKGTKKERISVRGKTFSERKITDKKLRSLFDEIKKTIEHVECIKSDGDVEKKVKEIETNNKYKDSLFQLVVFRKNSQLGQTKTIFYTIRNALAHGAFSVKPTKKETVYLFENKYHNEIKAQFRLKESTLIKWIDLVERFTK